MALSVLSEKHQAIPETRLPRLDVTGHRFNVASIWRIAWVSSKMWASG
jgi:hypothetical protein